APVERLEVERVAVRRPRRHVARDVAARRRVLDLDHLGAQVGERGGAERSRAELREREDAEAGEGRAAHAGTLPTPSVWWLRVGTRTLRRKERTRSSRWLTATVSTLTIPRSPWRDSRSSSTVEVA